MGRISLASGLRRLTVVFVAAWAIRNLIVTGDAVLNEHYGQVLRTAPAITQVAMADSFTQSLIRADHSLPKTSRIIVYWRNPPALDYFFFWSTYWLYPRRVTVVTRIDASVPIDADAVLTVRKPNEPEPGLTGFVPTVTDTHPDLVVTTFTKRT
jgi:hypothetical protein